MKILGHNRVRNQKHKTLNEKTRKEKHQRVSTTKESQDREAPGQETINMRDDPKQKGTEKKVEGGTNA